MRITGLKKLTCQRCGHEWVPRFARSAERAIGLMQLMPTTASKLGVRNPWDAEENLGGGIRYLARLLWEFRDVRKALAAYNAGPEVVRRSLAVPRETRLFVEAVLGHFKY